MYLDAAICLVAALFVLAGYHRGLILELGSIAGFFVGLALAAKYWFPAALYVHRWIQNDLVAAVLSFVAIFALTYFVVSLLASVIRRAAHLLFLGWLDGLGGAAIGLIKAAFVIELALLFVLRLPPAQTARWTAGSSLAPWFEAQQHALLGSVFAPFPLPLPLLG